MKANGPQAKILQHSTGLGAPDPTTVRQRAVEIAEIDGRKTPNQQDWEEAKRELHGGHGFIHENGNGGENMAYSVSESDMVAGSVGHHIENIGPEDTDNVVEELIAEGMDEAVHEQMLESRRRENGDSDEEDSYESE
jgi:hypothetical protein